MVDWRGFFFGSQGDPNRNRFGDGQLIRSTVQSGIQQAQGRGAPTMQAAQLQPAAMVDTARADQWRARSLGLYDQDAAVANGQQAGAGELATQRQGARTMAQATGAATMARGAGAAGARAAANAAGAIGLSTAGGAQRAALEDQAAARSRMASVAAAGQGADLNTAMANQGATNQFGLAQGQFDQDARRSNLEAELRQRGMNDQQIVALLGQLGYMNNAEMAARGADNGIVGGLLGTAGQIAGRVFG